MRSDEQVTSEVLYLRYISSLHSADEPQEGRNNCPLLRSYFIGSCHVGVSKRFSRSISLAVYCLSLYYVISSRQLLGVWVLHCIKDGGISTEIALLLSWLNQFTTHTNWLELVSNLDYANDVIMASNKCI